MKIATARKKTSQHWKTSEITWEAFLDRLRTPLRTAETVREYRAMGKEERDAAKEAAGGFVAGALNGGRRKTEFVTERSMLTLDADNARPGAWENVTMLVEYRMCCYTTHSHTEAKPRLRWIIPTSRAMTPDEYPAIARKVATWLGIETMDATTYEVARLMYWATCPKDGAYSFHEQDGPLLDPDEVLASYGPGEAWRDTTLWPLAKSETEVRKRLIAKAGEPTEKPGIVGLFCRTYDVPAAIEEFLPDTYTPAGTADRYTYAGGSTAAGAIVYNGGAFLYSNHATDPAGGRSVNAFDLVRIHRFGHLDSEDELDVPVTKLPSYEAMSRWASGLPEVKRELVAERGAEADETFSDLVGGRDTDADAAEGADADDPAPTDDGTDAPAPAPDPDWQDKLELHPKTGECEPTVNNALLILLNDPVLRGRFGYNKFSDMPCLRGDVPWRPAGSVKAGGRGTLWTDRDEAGLRWYLQERWKFRSENDLRNALELALHANAYHPVREYLRGLAWDGTPRLDTMLVDYLGAEDTPYTRAVTRKWMCGAVKRVMQPGCKNDQAIVLVGAQGIGKSSFAGILSRGWFNDSEINMNSKDGYESLHGNWIIELAELASTKRSDIETVKTFLSKCEDTYRPAYGRRAATFKRQCVFFGTTNEDEFLRDRTGNRRYWPVTVHTALDRDAFSANVDQLWAEAVTVYNKGESLWLDGEGLRREWEQVVAARTVQDELEGMIEEYLERPLPENWGELTPEARRDFINGDAVTDGVTCPLRREYASVTEIRVELCGEDRRRQGGNDQLSRRIAGILNSLPGWEKGEKRKKLRYYGPQWVYYRT